ncbi:MAG: hypothetical protein IPK13_07630 [Deltaproteobacteria bacterium]|nr:hypothetical protein [Deltaproteobacteria bacterium]
MSVRYRGIARLDTGAVSTLMGAAAFVAAFAVATPELDAEVASDGASSAEAADACRSSDAVA